MAKIQRPEVWRAYSPTADRVGPARLVEHEAFDDAAHWNRYGIGDVEDWKVQAGVVLWLDPAVTEQREGAGNG